MSDNFELNVGEYDDEQAIKFIRNYLPQELKEKFSDDDIQYVLDVVFEFYDSKGFFNEDISDDQIVDIDENELSQYVVKNAQKDQVGKFDPQDIQFIIQGEMEYCESLNMFE